MKISRLPQASDGYWILANPDLGPEPACRGPKGCVLVAQPKSRWLLGATPLPTPAGASAMPVWGCWCPQPVVVALPAPAGTASVLSLLASEPLVIATPALPCADVFVHNHRIPSNLLEVGAICLHILNIDTAAPLSTTPEYTMYKRGQRRKNQRKA